MDTKLISSKLKSVQALGFGSTDANLVFIDEWSDQYDIESESIKLFRSYLERSSINLHHIYITTAEKRWMHSEDEWHEALAMELELIRPRMVVALGNRKVKKMLLKVKDMVQGFRWFTEIHNHHVIHRFYHDDQFYIQQLNQLANDFQYDKELENSINLKSLSFVPL